MDATLEPFEQRLITVVLDFQQQLQSPVKTRQIADSVGQSIRTVRHYLRGLEEKNILFRPAGAKSGYSTKRDVDTRLWLPDDVVARKLTELDVILLEMLTDEQMTSSEIAVKLSMSCRTVRYRLRKLEALRLVKRPDGQRSGYTSVAYRDVLALAKAIYIVPLLKSTHIPIISELSRQPRGHFVKSKYLAGVLDVNPRSMRYYLKQLEDLGVIRLKRKPVRLGYYALQPLVSKIVALIGEENS